MKVVLDTNVFITAFKDEYSYQKRIIDEIIGGRLMAYANRQTLRENHLILRRMINDGAYLKELNNLFAKINVVENRRQIHAVSDKEDNKILESAVEARADFLITEDRALLELNPFRAVKIVEPGEFWVIYEEETGEDPWQKWIKFVKGSGN